MSEKVFSVNGEDDWYEDWSSLIDRLTDINLKDETDLIGKTYYEGDMVPTPMKKLVNINLLIDAMNETAWDIVGEAADDWPCLNDDQKQELEQVIADYLTKAKVQEFFDVKNVKEKTITAMDIPCMDKPRCEPPAGESLQELEDKFIVINRKRFKELNATGVFGHDAYFRSHPAVLELKMALENFQKAYEAETDKLLDQKYIVCNQDEPYAEEVARLVLGKTPRRYTPDR